MIITSDIYATYLLLCTPFQTRCSLLIFQGHSVKLGLRDAVIVLAMYFVDNQGPAQLQQSGRSMLLKMLAEWALFLR